MTVRSDQNPSTAPALPTPTRRDALLGVGGALAAALLPSGPVLAQQQPAAAAKADGLPTVLLEAKPAFVEFNPGKVTDLWAFGGRTPGPELRLRKGEEFRFRLVNGIAKPTSLHWHGVRTANEADGVAGLTQDPVAPGAGLDLRFTPPDAGTFIYRPCALGSSSEQSERGLSGVVVVEEASPAPVDLDQVLAIDDWRLAEDGQMEPFGADRRPRRRGTSRQSAHGERRPRALQDHGPPGARVRLRLANLCGARIMRIRFDGMKAYVVSVDGQPTDTFEPLRSILPFAPGSRYEVIADLPLDTGVTMSVTALIGNGLALAQIVTEGAPITQKRPAFRLSRRWARTGCFRRPSRSKGRSAPTSSSKEAARQVRTAASPTPAIPRGSSRSTASPGRPGWTSPSASPSSA